MDRYKNTCVYVWMGVCGHVFVSGKVAVPEAVCGIYGDRNTSVCVSVCLCLCVCVYCPGRLLRLKQCAGF